MRTLTKGNHTQKKVKMKRQTNIIILALATLGLASCSTDELTPEDVGIPEPKIVITQSGSGSSSFYRDTQFRLGRTCTLTAAWNFHTGDGTEPQWTTSNSGVRLEKEEKTYTTTLEMKATGMTKGSTTVTVTIGGRSEQKELEVLPLADFDWKQNGYEGQIYLAAHYGEFYRAEMDFGDGYSYTYYVSYNDSKYTYISHYFPSKATYTVSISLYDKSGNLIDSHSKSVTLI